MSADEQRERVSRKTFASSNGQQIDGLTRGPVLGQQDWLKTLSGMDIPPGARLGMTTDGNLLLLGVSGSLTRLSLNGLKKSLSGPSPESERDKTGSAGTARPSSDIHRHTLGLSAPFEGPFLQAEVNSHDKLLAIRTPSRVLVIVVPLPGLSSTQGSFKTTEVGASVFVGGLQVLQIEWHPRSASGTHLMVLSSDGLLRLFDLSISPEEPEQIFDLTRPGSQFPSSSQHILPSKNRRGIFSAETSEREVVSFAVGAAGDVGWSSLTVYAAMENGDIYSLCPVMPSTCSLSLGQVQSLRSRLGQPKNDEDSTEKKNRYWTLRWIQEVEEQIIRHEDSLPSDLVQVSLPKFHTKLGLFRQGPFLKPASSSDEDDESRSLTDMHIVFDLHAQYLWTAYSNGSVELRVNFRPPTPIWGNLNISGLDEPPEWTRSSLQYLETLELLESPSETLGSALTLVKDPKYSDVVYVAHSEGIHRLSLRPWKLLFDECLCSNPTSSLEALDFEIVFSECDWLVSTENPVTGLVVVTDIYLGYCYMTSTKEGRLYGSPLAIRAPSKPTAAFKIKMKASESVSYPSVLRGTSFTIPEVLKSIPAYIPISSSDSSTYPLFITEHSLPKFSKSVAQLRKRLEAIIGAGGQIQSRLTEHLHEQKAQLAILSSSQSVIDTFSPDALTARLTRIQERQVKMDQKADIILQILVDQTQPVVSKAEQEWLSELEELHGVVKRRIGQTVAQLKAQKELLAQKCLKLGTTQSNLVKTKVLGSSQIERIRRSLDVEFELIANVTRRTELLVQAMQRINLP